MKSILTDADIAEIKRAYPNANRYLLDGHIHTADGLTLMHSKWKGEGEAPYLLRAAAMAVVRWKQAPTGHIDYDVGRDAFLSFVNAYKNGVQS